MLKSVYKMIKVIKAKEKYFLYPKESASYLINVGLPKNLQLKREILEGERPLYLVYEKAWFGVDHYLFYKIIGKSNPKKYV